jgi:hypothetical protein
MLSDETLLSMRFVRHPHAAWRALPYGTASTEADLDGPPPEQEVIIVDPVESISHYLLDDVSVFIWTNMDGELTVEELVHKICDEFDVDPQTARADTLEFIRELLGRNLLVEAK